MIFSKRAAFRGLAVVLSVFLLTGAGLAGCWKNSGTHGKEYYIDAAAGNDGNKGTSIKSPWKTLGKLKDITFQPGDKILLKAGSVWNGEELPLSGSGAEGSPIIVDQFGEGAKPVINGNGIAAVIALQNQEYWEINNLEITNDDDFSVDENSESVHRRGISLIARDIGTLDHIYIRNCDIHDIDANNEDKDSGGIIGRIEGDTPQTWFNDILFENNIFRKIDRTGINFAFNSAADELYTNRNNSKVVIRSNTFSDIGGDGIIAIGCKSPLIEYNILDNCRSRTTQASVAIFPWQCTNTLIQYNEAFQTRVDNPNSDGQAFDCDYGNNGTIYQYNYSHDNEGGFMLLCSPGDSNEAERSYNSIVRYNISQNDKMRVFRLVGPGTRYSKIYNNTIYLSGYVKGDVVVNETWNGLAGEASFENNIFYILNNGKFAAPAQFSYDSNCYYGVPGPFSDTNKISADPMIVKPGGADKGRETCDAYKLQAASPCINAGKEIADNGGKDFFGSSLYTDYPDLGAIESDEKWDGSARPSPKPPLKFEMKELAENISFESGKLEPWTFEGSYEVVKSDAHTGSYSVKLDGESGNSTVRLILKDLMPNTSYTLSGWAKVEGKGDQISIGVKDFGGGQIAYYADTTDYTQITIEFTTGHENTSAMIFAWKGTPGFGYADDFSLMGPVLLQE